MKKNLKYIVKTFIKETPLGVIKQKQFKSKDPKKPCWKGFTQVTKQEYEKQQKLKKQDEWKPDYYYTKGWWQKSHLCVDSYDEIERALSCNPKKRKELKIV